MGRMPRVVAQGKASIEEADEAVRGCCKGPLQQLVADSTGARCRCIRSRVQGLDTCQLPTMPPASSLPQVMYVRLKEEGTTPITFHVEDSAIEGRGSQSPLRTSTRLHDGEGGGAGVSPLLDPTGVSAAVWLKQRGAHIVNVSQQGISLHYQEGDTKVRSRVAAGEGDGPAISQVIVNHKPWERLGHDRGDGGNGSPHPRKCSVIRA